MFSIDIEKDKNELRKEINVNSRKSWLIYQDFESLQLKSDQQIKNRTARIHSDFLLEIENANVFGYKTVISQNKYFSDEILHDDFSSNKLSKTNFSPISGQIEYDSESNILRIDDTLQRDTVKLDTVIGVFSDEPSNYGSFMYRVLPKIKRCLDLGYHDATYMFFDKPYMHQIIYNLLGVKLKTISHKHALKYEVKNLLLPSLRVKNCLYGPDCLDLYRNGAMKIEKKGVGKFIYISRRKMAETKPNFRVMFNELELIRALEKLGYQEFVPEEHDTQTQIATFRDAEEIVVAGGSALFNLPYARNANFIIDLESSNHWIYAHSNILYSVGVPFSVIYGKQLSTGFKLHKNWNVDIQEVLRRVERLRFKYS